MIRHSRDGFTLVEWLIVIVILGMRAGIGLPPVDVANFQVNSAVQALSTTMAASQPSTALLPHNPAGSSGIAFMSSTRRASMWRHGLPRIRATRGNRGSEKRKALRG